MILRVLMIGVFLLVVRPAALSACSCGNNGAEPMIRTSDAVFSGTLVAQRVLDSDDAPNAELTFRVDRYWKGGRSAKVVLLSYVGGPCPVTYPLGEHLLVYGSKTEHGLEGGGFCSRIRPLHDAGEDLSLLGRGWRPKESLLMGSDGARLLGGGLAALLLGVLGLLLRGRTRNVHA